jgi:hypothetical protein
MGKHCSKSHKMRAPIMCFYICLTLGLYLRKQKAKKFFSDILNVPVRVGAQSCKHQLPPGEKLVLIAFLFH